MPMILVVDDDIAMQEFSVRALIQLGYQAVGRGDEESAIAVVETTPSLQVLLSDIQLTYSTGPEMVRRMLRIRPDLKVVFMTGGYADATFRRTDPVLDKPFSLRRLQQAIDSVLNPVQPRLEGPPTANDRRRQATL